MLSDTRLVQQGQLKIEQKLRHKFLLQRGDVAPANILVSVNNHKYHIDRSNQLGNADTSIAYHSQVALTALKMLGNAYRGDDNVTQ